MVKSIRSSKRRKLSHPTTSISDTESVHPTPHHPEHPISKRASTRANTKPLPKTVNNNVQNEVHDVSMETEAGAAMRKSIEGLAYNPDAHDSNATIENIEGSKSGSAPTEDEGGEFVPRSSGRQRRAPRRLSNEMVMRPMRQTSQLPPTTKDLSSPGAFGAVDTPTRSTPKRGRPRKTAQEKVLRREDEDTQRTSYRSSPLRPLSKASAVPSQKQSKIPLEDEDMVRERNATVTDPMLNDDQNRYDLDYMRVSNATLNSSISSAKRLLTNGFTFPSALESNSGGSDHTSQIENIKHIVLGKLTGRRPIPLVNLEDEYAKVHVLLEQTVAACEGNSMLLIGARGTAKSALVNAVLLDLAKKHGDDFHIIRLNGFIQTDDKLALREIWRQLGREMELEEEGQSKNYADTLATLLALLSHPSELAGADVTQMHVAKSVVFIMDEFDLFAAHPRQTLLYNLFDIAQSRKAPIAVLGLTTRIDIAESLEKRVKSRFSHRYVHFGFVKNLVGFVQICKTALQIQPDELNFNERARLGNGGPAARGHEICSVDLPNQDLSLESWNASIETLFSFPTITNHLSRIYHTTKSIPTALNLFLLPVSLLDPTNPYLTPTSLSTHDLLPPDSRLTLLPSLPTLALALLVAAARLDIILDSDTCNFNMAYEEYSKLAAKARINASVAASATGVVGVGGRAAGKQVARGAWERLCELDLLVPAAGKAGVSTGMGGGSEMVRCDIKLEEIPGAVPDMERGLEKWCREL